MRLWIAEISEFFGKREERFGRLRSLRRQKHVNREAVGEAAIHGSVDLIAHDRKHLEVLR